MKNKLFIVVPLVIVILCFILGAIFYKSKKETELQTNVIPMEKLVKSDSEFLGTDHAKVTMVEFLDPECSACAAYFPMIKGLVSDYKDRIKFVTRYMLLHSHSKEAAAAIEAAAKQGKRWEMLAQLFHRKEWVNQEKLRSDIFEEIAKNLGLNITQFKSDSQDSKIIERVMADHQEAIAIGVHATPTIFINGRELNEISYEKIKERLDKELK